MRDRRINNLPILLARVAEVGLMLRMQLPSGQVTRWPWSGYRQQILKFSSSIRGSIIIALAGGIIGAILLANIGNRAFLKLIPFLILFATLLFAFGAGINKRLRARANNADFANPRPTTRLLELLFAIYGGFFGAGLGVMLMAGLQMLGVSDIQANNALHGFSREVTHAH